MITTTILQRMLTVTIVGGTVLMATSAFAEGTAEQRAACTPDVFRLCSGDIPNVAQITACLRRERAQVSQACRSAMGPQSTEVASNQSVRKTAVR